MDREPAPFKAREVFNACSGLFSSFGLLFVAFILLRAYITPLWVSLFCVNLLWIVLFIGSILILRSQSAPPSAHGLVRGVISGCIAFLILLPFVLPRKVVYYFY